MEKQINILLVTEGADGHHLAFMEIFIASLNRLGANITILMPQVQRLKHHLEQKQTDRTALSFYEYDNVVKNEFVVDKFTPAYRALLRWRKLKKTAKNIENEKEEKFNLIFLSFLDPYLSNYLPYQLIDNIFPYTWSGLYFHPKFLRYNPEEGKFRSGVSSIDNVIRSKRCIAIGTHDDKLIEALKFRTDKPIVFFPEIADLATPDIEQKLFTEIKQKAKGRKTIGLVGCEKRKGFYTLIKLAKQKPEGYYFVFAGKFSSLGYSDEEINEIESFLTTSSENVFYYPHYLQEGAEINSFLAALDVIYIVYQGFTSTSNFSTKAAFLRKPVVATEKYIIGDDTRDFKLGVTVRENDLDDLKNGLERLEEKVKQNDFLFEKYLEKHSVTKLDVAFKSILSMVKE